MNILFVTVVLVFTATLGKYLFKKWFNHLLLYSASWALFLILYELKLIRYIDISMEAYLIFFIAYLGVISGALTVYFARNVFLRNEKNLKEIQIDTVLFNNNFYILKFLIIFVSVLGLYGAYENWTYLLQKFGSFSAIVMRANAIYRMRIAGELEGGIPYLSILPYVGIVFSGIYTAAKARISLYTFLPLISIILSDIAAIGRGGIFVGCIMLGTSFMLFRHIVPRVINYRFNPNKKNLIIGFIVLIVIIVSSLTLVAELRGRFTGFKGKSRSFNKLDAVPLISAAEYFYFSSNVAVFSKYFELQRETSLFAENTLLPAHNILSKFGFIEHPKTYPEGYRIPTWSNAGTFLRDLHSDFGVVGMFLIPFLLSLVATYFWFMFISNGDIIALINLIYLFVIISLSTFNMQTRAAFFLVSYLMLLFVIQILDRLFNKGTHENISIKTT